jgi:hypothetical protein
VKTVAKPTFPPEYFAFPLLFSLQRNEKNEGKKGKKSGEQLKWLRYVLCKFSVATTAQVISVGSNAELARKIFDFLGCSYFRFTLNNSLHSCPCLPKKSVSQCFHTSTLPKWKKKSSFMLGVQLKSDQSASGGGRELLQSNYTPIPFLNWFFCYRGGPCWKWRHRVLCLCLSGSLPKHHFLSRLPARDYKLEKQILEAKLIEIETELQQQCKKDTQGESIACNGLLNERVI